MCITRPWLKDKLKQELKDHRWHRIGGSTFGEFSKGDYDDLKPPTSTPRCVFLVNSVSRSWRRGQAAALASVITKLGYVRCVTRNA